MFDREDLMMRELTRDEVARARDMANRRWHDGEGDWSDTNTILTDELNATLRGERDDTKPGS